MASSSNSWMPPYGKYPVAVGSSLGRTLKARNHKGGDPPPPAPSGKRGIPTKDYFSFRYNFQPPSTDSNKQGNIEVERSGEVGIGRMQKASTQPGEGHQFKVVEYPSKEYDCVVIFDEETMSFTLEKLDSQVHITYEHRIAMPGTPAPPVNPPPPVDLEAELERELLGADDDADGEIDEEVISTSVALREEEEEPEEGEEEEIIIPPPPPPATKAKPRKSTVPAPGKPRQAPTKATPAPTPIPKAAPPPPAPPVAASLPPKPKAKPKPAPVPVPRAKKAKPAAATTSHPLADAEEEDLQFGRPAKRARPSPPSEGLALPGASASIYTPPPMISTPTTSTRALPPPPAPVSESEEEWDEVVDVTKGDDDAAEDDFDIFGDAAGGEDIDVNAFEMELNLQMEESDDDFLAAAVSPEPEDEPVRGVPISLKQLAAGAGGVYASEDEYSSSDESDDD